MRKLILSLHTTLDGFVAGPNGEMDWIKLDAELFDLVGKFTDEADAALYGRVTYQMMNSYWPTAGDQPDASKHDIQHSGWYNRVEKIVLSRTMEEAGANKTTVIRDNVAAEVQKIKSQPGKNVLIFGSPTAAHTLMAHGLIDEYWLFVNPILLGEGIPVFANIVNKTALKLVTSKVFPCGVIGLNYTVVM
jgi:dihydrofolate reductase